ncbi:VOC family protein [Ornithinimicrobium cavernae]|uniref:VOC family protein n=1 Tax=Ornithinimicrobium cavernae TaxID=2666047 RepID=UPI001F2410BB|nr:VOC family protein [Ornithinimicrobium cavernae]
MSTRWTLGCDARDPHLLAAFWAPALGYVPEPGYDDPDGASIIDPDGTGPAISWLRVEESKSAKNRVQIDIRVAGEPPWDWAERAGLIRSRVEELVAAGATAVREENYADDTGREVLGHVVMLDPRGQRVLRGVRERSRVRVRSEDGVPRPLSGPAAITEWSSRDH